jgi:long-chain acyl-CoA synthetase
VTAPDNADTFPRLLQHHARVRPNAPAIREKDLGIWQSWSWLQMLQEVREIAAGLLQAGFKRGAHLAIIGENRPHLYFTMAAAQCLGGIPVPMYQDAVAAEMAYVFDNAEIAFAMVEDQEQVDKALEVREKVPHLARIFYDDPRGLRNYQQAGLASYEQLRAAGQQALREHPGLVDAEIDLGRSGDTAAMFYTSGTTGNPKGVVLGYDNLIAAGRAGAEMEGLTSKEEVLAYLPMAWIGQNIFSYTQWLVCGFTVNCPESEATVTADMREIGPTYYFAPPRVLEALLTHVMIRMEDATSSPSIVRSAST